MATPYGIKDMANSARDAKYAISAKNSTYDRSASSLSSSWKGEAGSAFKDATKRAKQPVTAVINGFGELYTKLTGLSNSVKRAEREKK